VMNGQDATCTGWAWQTTDCTMDDAGPATDAGPGTDAGTTTTDAGTADGGTANGNDAGG
jgi:hypothetical protein